MHHFLVAGRDDPQPLLAKQCLEESGVGHGIMEDSRKRSLATAEIYDEYKNRLKKGRKLEKATEGRVTKAPRIRKKESEADKRYHDEAEQAQKPQEEGYEEQGSCWKGQNI
ncbi:hypothetical protein P152DRAFT_458854 [Eremomyces bilateralis CBS 781.70]|uniref:Uncharacterized protein n=1 Tax=Eremomyces bilateralis CBS 781.70 TaxID=1392243 RepID=A0A6G1G1K5_9PEZI|nr:uncharacterized protein P152DRAFT_458854 [Eremomyces bilateralis CBS 781.70]KAF1811898.1 hypothetical protein P152DRAFT_458854 [Eremomyces bilateralis CBS 781.70]